MEMSLLLNIGGIAVAAIFGIWGIYTTIKHRYGGSVTFICEQTISIFDDIVKHLPDLGVYYKNEAVTKALVLIKGVLVNDGQIDITPNDVEKPISAVLPDRCTWLESKVISCSTNLKANLVIELENNLYFKTGMFRKNESIHFQALAEIDLEDNKSNKIEELLTFEHRIANTKKIKIQQVEKPRSPKAMRFKLLAGMLFILFGISLMGMLYLSEFHYQIIFEYYLDTEEATEVVIKPKRDDMIEYENKDLKVSGQVEASEFLDNLTGTAVTAPNQTMLMSVIIGSFIYVAMGSYYLLSVYSERRKRIYISKILTYE